ncbi:hypothetical protein QTL95_24510 [Rhizobium sp. S152]|uniref:hypothetical protein n=1 Tax=Rhizobium sp. S152 TaxID=3055038 RepID=UPI0025A94445|nr:hypothetical protein [Rhizobium sp. S152]MDM9629059.1 hypothetical protein [Rhizobium sp. S152]
MTNSQHAVETTRRSFLTGAAASITEAAGAGRIARGGNGVGDADPVVSLWQEWLVAHKSFGEACRRQQTLETEMLRELRSFPRVKIVFSEDEGFVWAYTAEEIDRLLPNSRNEDVRRKAWAELATQNLDWNAVDVRIGYSKAKETEAENADREDELSDALWGAAPQSFAGIAAKLHCVLETEDPGSGLQEAPWPQLRAILADLVRIATPGD